MVFSGHWAVLLPPNPPNRPVEAVPVADESAACSTFAAGQTCQAKIVGLQGTNSNINIYNLNTIGSISMLDNSGTTVAGFADNENVYPSTVALFRLS